MSKLPEKELSNLLDNNITRKLIKIKYHSSIDNPQLTLEEFENLNSYFGRYFREDLPLIIKISNNIINNFLLKQLDSFEPHLKKFAEEYLKVVNDSFFWKEPGAERGKTYRFKNIGFKFTGEDEHCHFYKKIVVLYTK